MFIGRVQLYAILWFLTEFYDISIVSPYFMIIYDFMTSGGPVIYTQYNADLL